MAHDTPAPAARTAMSPREIRAVLEHYPLGTARSIRPMKIGSPASPKVVIQCDSERFVLKRRGPGRDDPMGVARIHATQLAVEQAGVPVARLIGTRDNNSMLQLDGRVYEMTMWIEGRPYAHTPAHAGAGGRALRALHTALAQVRGVRGFDRGSYHRAEHVEARLAHIASGLDHEHARIVADVLGLYRHAGQISADADAEPRQIVHGDWHPGNLIYQDDGQATIVDFDTLRIARRVTDAASGALWFSLPRHPDSRTLSPSADWDLARAFTSGYGESLDSPRARVLCGLMGEALIAEAVVPIARTGLIGHEDGVRVLEEVRTLVRWILGRADAG